MNILKIFKRKKKDFECYGRCIIYRSFVEKNDLKTCLESVNLNLELLTKNMRQYLFDGIRAYKENKERQ